MAKSVDSGKLARAVVAGERAALSRAITLVESTRAEDRSLAQQLLRQIQKFALQPSTILPTQRLGITGSPGVGKSTFIEAFGTQLLDAGHRLAVLAVDPSSVRTGGSILGDKTRMPNLSADPRAYVRPSPAGQTLGGVARATRQAIKLCEAAGYDRIIVETVGVGQSEHLVHQLVDAMVLLVMPGGGDDLQGIKRGIVELADLILVHKADGDALPTARRTKDDYRRAVHLQPARADGWSPTVTLGSSVSGGGLASFGDSLQTYFTQLGSDKLLERRAAQRRDVFEALWPTLASDVLRENAGLITTLRQLKSDVTDGVTDADAAAHKFAALLSDLLNDKLRP